MSYAAPQLPPPTIAPAPEPPPPGGDSVALGIVATVAFLVWTARLTKRNPPGPTKYDDFRLGLTFGDVRELLSGEQDAAYASGGYMFVSRSTVLGRWHQMKREAYDHYRAAYAAGEAD